MSCDRDALDTLTRLGNASGVVASVARSRVRVFLAFALLMLSSCGAAQAPARDRLSGGDPDAGREVVAAIGCGACHAIPGVPGARGTVGPSLAGFARRAYIAGVAPNSTALLIRWVRDAPSIASDTAMPALPLSEPQARDVAAYLYTLR